MNDRVNKMKSTMQAAREGTSEILTGINERWGERAMMAAV